MKDAPARIELLLLSVDKSKSSWSVERGRVYGILRQLRQMGSMCITSNGATFITRTDYGKLIRDLTESGICKHSQAFFAIVVLLKKNCDGWEKPNKGLIIP